MASPFLKWAGGKSRLVPAVAEAVAGLAPGRYIEPFLGGGAMFFGLRERGLIGAAILNDFNPQLIEAYSLVRDDAPAVIAGLRNLEDAYLAAPHEERARIYYGIRANVPPSAPGRVVRLIFLNKTCFNGLYRVNRKGEFNVPHGRYVRPRICSPGVLNGCAEALHESRLLCADFVEVCETASAGDLVYLDPPYQPISPTSSFTAYTESSFGMADQVRLAHAVKEMTQRGAHVVLSNSAHPLLEELYRGYHVRKVKMARAINSVGRGRAPIDELLITNFEWGASADDDEAPDLTNVA
jgi:DNA adenine methylase